MTKQVGIVFKDGKEMNVAVAEHQVQQLRQDMEFKGHIHIYNSESQVGFYCNLDEVKFIVIRELQPQEEDKNDGEEKAPEEIQVPQEEKGNEDGGDGSEEGEAA